MDKVKINSVNGNLVNATFTFDDANVPSITVNLNDMTVSDGDILATELNKYGQAYKADCLARIPSQAVASSVGSEFGYVDGAIVPISTSEIPNNSGEDPDVVPEDPIAPEENPV